MLFYLFFYIKKRRSNVFAFFRRLLRKVSIYFNFVNTNNSFFVLDLSVVK